MNSAFEVSVSGRRWWSELFDILEKDSRTGKLVCKSWCFFLNLEVQILRPIFFKAWSTGIQCHSYRVLIILSLKAAYDSIGCCNFQAAKWLTLGTEVTDGWRWECQLARLRTGRPTVGWLDTAYFICNLYSAVDKLLHSNTKANLKSNPSQNPTLSLTFTLTLTLANRVPNHNRKRRLLFQTSWWGTFAIVPIFAYWWGTGYFCDVVVSQFL